MCLRAGHSLAAVTIASSNRPTTARTPTVEQCVGQRVEPVQPCRRVGQRQLERKRIEQAATARLRRSFRRCLSALASLARSDCSNSCS